MIIESLVKLADARVEETSLWPGKIAWTIDRTCSADRFAMWRPILMPVESQGQALEACPWDCHEPRVSPRCRPACPSFP